MIHLIRQTFLSLQQHVDRQRLEPQFPVQVEVLPASHPMSRAHQPSLKVAYAGDVEVKALSSIKHGEHVAWVSDGLDVMHTAYVISDGVHAEIFDARVLMSGRKSYLQAYTPFEFDYAVDAVIRPWVQLHFYLARQAESYTLYQTDLSSALPAVALVDNLEGWRLEHSPKLLAMTLKLPADDITLWMTSADERH